MLTLTLKQEAILYQQKNQVKNMVGSGEIFSPSGILKILEITFAFIIVIIHRFGDYGHMIFFGTSASQMTPVSTCGFIWERNKNYSSNSHPKIWYPWNFTMESIPKTIFPLDWSGTLYWTENIPNNFDFTDTIWEVKDFKFLNVSVGSDICSLIRKSHF